MSLRRNVSFAVVLAVLITFAAPTGFAADWPNYHGPDHNGISNETGWDHELSGGNPKKLWKANVGMGYSSFTVVDGRVYTMGNTGKKGRKPQKDEVFCFDAETGKQIWKHSYDEELAPKYYQGGTSSTPTVKNGKVYILSKSAKAFCLDAKTGAVIWKSDLQKQFGIPDISWGLAGSVLAIDNMVIYNAGSYGLALNAKDGSLIWQTGTGNAGYATPVPYKKDGQLRLAMFVGNDIAGVVASTGKVLWKYPWETKHGVNAADPIISGDKVFISSGYGKGCTLIKIEGSNATEVWVSKKMRNHMNSCVLYNGYLYGFDESTLKCIEFETGAEKWAQKGLGKASLMLADGKLIILSEKGKLVIADPSPQKFKKISTAKVLKGSSWTVPVLANGRIYVRNSKGDVVCLDVSKTSTAASASTSVSASKNWAQWHGPNRDNISPETGLLKKWPDNGPKMLWSIEDLGKGFSTVSISDSTIYLTGMKGEDGILTAVDTGGNIKWQKPYAKEWKNRFPGSRSTPTIDNGNAYIIATTGTVVCLDAKTGEKKWSVDIFDRFDGSNIHFGMAESPLIDGDKLICSPGGKDAAIVALNKNTGETIWQSKGLSEKSAYCSPILVERGKNRIIVTWTERSVVGINVENGDPLWVFPMVAPEKKRGATLHPITPIYHDGNIYFSSGYDIGSIKLALSEDGTSVKELWRDDNLDCHHGGIVLVDGYLYGSNWLGNPKGNWVCLEFASGKLMYEHTWNGKGSLTYADGMLYCYDEKKGMVGLVKATPKGFEITSSFKVPMGTNEHWAHPVVMDGRLYIRHGDALMVYDISKS